MSDILIIYWNNNIFQNIKINIRISPYQLGAWRLMLFFKPLSVCEAFINDLNETLKILGGNKLSNCQKLWLSICITAIIVTNSVCWERFSRACFGAVKSNNLSKMFRRSLISWDKLLYASVTRIFKYYDITKGVLALDDTDNKRSKKTKRIHQAHKIKDKSSGGFVNGQELIFLLLITDKITIPVGFAFYSPDPDYTAWRKKDKELRKALVLKSQRPPKPIPNSKYPSKLEVAIKLIQDFKTNHSNITIQAILADALYGASNFVIPVINIYPGVQIISQAKCTQKVKYRNKYITVKEYFEQNKGVPAKIKIRGGIEKDVSMHGARLYLKSHKAKRFIIALKYEEEEKYRYLLGVDLTWRLTDIATAYSLRWLVEVFIFDWKSYEGWCQLAKQPDCDGSCRGVILSLLIDHCLLLHPEQKAMINNKLPALTVGSLRDQERAKAVLESVEELLKSDNPQLVIDALRLNIAEIVPLRQSSKHMSGRELGRLEPTPSLRYYAA
jgi:hypothetical protein